MKFYSQDEIVGLIVERLNFELKKATSDFENSSAEVGVRYCYVDNLLPEEVVKNIYNAFPDSSKMRLMDSFRERKFTSKNFDEFDPILKAITFAIQDPRVIEVVEKITGIKGQIPDPSLYAGGLSAMAKGHFLGPHIDNSHEATRKYYRTLNLLYYITPDWTLENGGNLELWDVSVKSNATIVSSYNRLAIMETTPSSWHSVSKVNVDKVRCCVSNYYFSEISPTGQEYFNVTSFSARPEQFFLRFVTKFDNLFRQTIRKIKPDGLGKKDVYQGNTNGK